MKVLIFSIILLFVFCGNNQTTVVPHHKTKLSFIDSLENTVGKRFLTPYGFHRTEYPANQYASFLRQLKMLPISHLVRHYDGAIKPNKVYDGVLALDVGGRDLQQCADAVMRLRAEYLFKEKRYQEISFLFMGDGKMHPYLAYAGTDRSYAKFRKYLNYIFSYANTASLKKQLKSVAYSNISIGDVLVQSGNPYGHAITVMDICQDSLGNKLVLYAQSYMPAQEIHVLKNFNEPNISPWYSLNSAVIDTPEWRFDSTDLRRF